MRFGGTFTLAALLASLAGPALAAPTAKPAAKPAVKVAVLKFGTVNWELNVIKQHHLDEKAGIALKILPLASTQATKIALQSGTVDIAVTDWLWVSRQRATGSNLTFLPYSTALGAVMVASHSDIKKLSDLKGRKLGIAGGPLDKSWLMLRAFAEKSAAGDLADEVEPIYGAPPLLAAKLRQGELDAVLNFWHYCARLEADGFRRLIDMSAVVKSFSGSGAVPMIGYTFRESWATNHKAALAGFRVAIAGARKIMATSNAEWRRLRPLTRASSDQMLNNLRDGFRKGIPANDDPSLQRKAAILFAILSKMGGAKLVGPAKQLSKGTFWQTGN